MQESQVQQRRIARFLAAPSIMLVVIVLVLIVLVATAAFGQRAQIPYPNPINHVIIIDQENRTIDNLFGSNAPANQYYLPGLVFATSGKASTLVSGKKTVITV